MVYPKTLDQTTQYRKTNHGPILFKLWRSSFHFSKDSSNRKPATACNPYMIGHVANELTSSQIPWRPYARTNVLPVQERGVGEAGVPCRGSLHSGKQNISGFWFEMKSNIQYTELYELVYPMVFILDGCSFHYAHTGSKSGISICWRHLVTSKESLNPIFSEKNLVFIIRVQREMNNHLI